MSQHTAQFDINDLHRSFNKARKNFSQSDFFHQEILDRLIDRLELVKISPEIIVILDVHPERSVVKLQEKYPNAKIELIDAVSGEFKLENDSVDLIFSNLLFHWLPDPENYFKEISRVLKPNGLLMFTMLGPDTLKECRFSWLAVDEFPHVHDFYDMHDIGDSLLRSNLAEPVMDMEQLTINYGSVQALFSDLKNAGSLNVNIHRRKTLTGKKRFQRFLQTFEKAKIKGKYALTFEVIYGHAWGGVVRNKGEVEVSIKDIKKNIKP